MKKIYITSTYVQENTPHHLINISILMTFKKIFISRLCKQHAELFTNVKASGTELPLRKHKKKLLT
jgi:hypothetical protein